MRNDLNQLAKKFTELRDFTDKVELEVIDIKLDPKKKAEWEKKYPVRLPNGLELPIPIAIVSNNEVIVNPERIYISEYLKSVLSQNSLLKDNSDALFSLCMQKLKFYRISQRLNELDVLSVEYSELCRLQNETLKVINDTEKQMGIALGLKRDDLEQELTAYSLLQSMIDEAQEYILNNMHQVGICPKCNAILLGEFIVNAKLHPFFDGYEIWNDDVLQLVIDGKLDIFDASRILRISPKGFIESCKKRNISMDVIKNLERQLKKDE